MKDDIFAEHKTYDLDSLILSELDSLDDGKGARAADDELLHGNHRLEFVIEDDTDGDHVATDHFDDEPPLDSMQHAQPHDDAMLDDDTPMDEYQDDENSANENSADEHPIVEEGADEYLAADAAAIDENDEVDNNSIPAGGSAPEITLDDTFLQDEPPSLNEYLEHDTQNQTITVAENKIFQSPSDVNLQVSCEIGAISITLDELSHLKVGDCLEFMHKANKVKLRLNNTTVFAEGYLVDVNGMLGVKITNTTSSIER